MIKVGFCVSYDWKMLKISLPRIYAFADIICLSIDKNRRSWTGAPYDFSEVAFSEWLATVDVEKKIDLYEDDFSLPGLTAMENDSRQRNLMGKRMGKGGWHVQIDSDEYFLDFGSFVKGLRKIKSKPTGNEKPLNVCAGLIPLIKKIDSGYLFVDFRNGEIEVAPFATNHPVYERARRNGHFNILLPIFVIHETWARSDEDMWFKMNNWGHSGDELNAIAVRESYFKLWQVLDAYNYRYIRNFHPAVPQVWPALAFLEASSVNELLEKFIPSQFPVSFEYLKLKNSRTVARLRSLWMKVFRSWSSQ
jgi:hypothetical protein